MPYFIYRVKPFAQLDQLAEHSGFAAASAQAKQLRRALNPDATEKIKLMFAASATEAEDLLCQIRDAAPAGEEYAADRRNCQAQSGYWLRRVTLANTSIKLPSAGAIGNFSVVWKSMGWLS